MTYTFKQYAEDANRTLAPAKNTDFSMDYLHAVLGLGSELVELEAAIENNDAVNVMEEVADMFWYLSIFYGKPGFEGFTFVVSGNEPIDMGNSIMWLREYTAEITDRMKRHIFYGENLIDNDHEGSIDWLVIRTFNALRWLLHEYDFTVGQAQRANIAKLKARYPEKFTAEDALNRDTDAERKILEAL